MRISDWSSDVCSSDLQLECCIDCLRSELGWCRRASSACSVFRCCALQKQHQHTIKYHTHTSHILSQQGSKATRQHVLRVPTLGVSDTMLLRSCSASACTLVGSWD